MRETRGNDFDKSDRCGTCGEPRRRLFAANRGGGKNSRTQHGKMRKCRRGHVSMKAK